jgi:hypothetical protein
MEGENERGGRIGSETRETLNLLNIDFKSPLFGLLLNNVFLFQDLCLL